MYMNTLILLFHVIAMTVSVVAMTAALGGALMGARRGVQLAKIGTITTLMGSAAGAYLLILHPATMECVMLASYVAGVMLVYRYVFAMGNVARCAWVRERN